jgi:hypothetical protein
VEWRWITRTVRHSRPNRLLALGMPSGDIGIENRDVPTFSEKKAFVKLRIIAPVSSGRFNVFIFFFLFLLCFFL